MKVRLQKYENDDDIKLQNLKTNDKIDLNMITKPQKTKISLGERFTQYNGENLAKDFVWDENRGKKYG